MRRGRRGDYFGLVMLILQVTQIPGIKHLPINIVVFDRASVVALYRDSVTGPESFETNDHCGIMYESCCCYLFRADLSYCYCVVFSFG